MSDEQEDREQELRLYLVIRGDLEVPFGKMLAQAGHAFCGVLEAARLQAIDERLDFGTMELEKRLSDYQLGATPKITIHAKNLAALERAEQECRNAGIPVHVVRDAGRTVFPEPTVTCMGIGPVRRAELPQFVRRMRMA